MEKSEIIEITRQLINLGEDRDEMDYWVEIYDELTREEQEKLAQNLQEELEELKSGRGKQPLDEQNFDDEQHE